MFYKETRVQESALGKIPEEWEVVKLSDCCLKIADRDHRTPNYIAEGFPIIAPENFIGVDEIDFKNCGKISQTELERDIKKCDPRQGDTLLSRIGSVGQVRKVRTNQLFSVLHSIALLRPDTAKIDGDYLYFWLQGKIAQKSIRLAVQSISTPDIGLGKIQNFPILIPKCEEQKRVSAIFLMVDYAIKKTGEVIAKTERLKKGLMQELLTKGIGHTEYKQTPIGTIPKEWDVVTLEDVCDQRSEMFQPSGNATYRFVGLEHISTGQTRIHTSAQDISVKSSKFRFFKEDILYGKLRPYLDKAVLIDFDGICSTDLLVLKSKKDISKEFLVYVLHSEKFLKHAIATTSGTNHPRTSWKAISRFKLGLPKPPEQQKIAETLSTIDKKLEVEKNEKAKLERIKLGLMDLLLTGKVRIKVE